MHHVLTWEDELSEADAVAKRAVPMLRSAGDQFGLALLDIQIAVSYLQAKDHAACAAACEAGLARLPEGELWARSYLTGLGGNARFMMGAEADGAAGLRTAIALNAELDDIVGIAYGTGMLGIMAAVCGRYERAAWLLGAAGSLWKHSGVRYAGHPFFEEQHRRAAAATEAALGAERYEIVSRRAASASVAEIVDLAVRDADGPPARA
jgi:non-specific serine/threonine protein kinase